MRVGEGRGDRGRKEGRREGIIIIIIIITTTTFLELVHGEQVGLNQLIHPFHTHTHSLHTHYLPTTHSFIHAFEDAKIHLNLTV